MPGDPYDMLSQRPDYRDPYHHDPRAIYEKMMAERERAIHAQYEHQFKQWQESTKQPRVADAVNAYLTEEAIWVETAEGLKVRLPAAVARRLTTLLEMAALTQVVPADVPTP